MIFHFSFHIKSRDYEKKHARHVLQYLPSLAYYRIKTTLMPDRKLPGHEPKKTWINREREKYFDLMSTDRADRMGPREGRKNMLSCLVSQVRLLLGSESCLWRQKTFPVKGQPARR